MAQKGRSGNNAYPQTLRTKAEEIIRRTEPSISTRQITRLINSELHTAISYGTILQWRRALLDCRGKHP
jgi:hypothetical protein